MLKLNLSDMYEVSAKHIQKGLLLCQKE